MITAGTIAAYLTLSTDDFNTNLSEAFKMLQELDTRANAASVAMGLLDGSLSYAGTSAQSLLAPMISSAANTVSGAVLGMNSTVQSVMTAMGMSFSSAASSASASSLSIGSVMTNAASVVASAVSTAVASVGNFVNAEPIAKSSSETVRNAIVTPFNGISGTLSGLMSNAGSSMANALSASASSILAVARNIASQVTATIKSALQIASPSKVMRKLGAYTGEGLALGISDMAPQVEKSSRMLALAAQAGAEARLEYSSGIPTVNSVFAQNVFASGTSSQPDMSSISSRLDRLIDLLADSEQIMRVDGRTFGKLIREYSV